MGSANWISVGGNNKDEVLARLYFAERTPLRTSASMNRDDMGVQEIPAGRTLLYCGERLFSPEMAAAASVGGDAIYGWMTEVVTASATTRFVDGKEAWSIESEVDREPQLRITGDFPAGFDEIINAAEAEGYTFEVPFVLSAKFGGYRPDIDLFDPNTEMRLIEPTELFDENEKRNGKQAGRATRAVGPGLLGRLFGRK